MCVLSTSTYSKDFQFLWSNVIYHGFESAKFFPKAWPLMFIKYIQVFLGKITSQSDGVPGTHQ